MISFDSIAIRLSENVLADGVFFQSTSVRARIPNTVIHLQHDYNSITHILEQSITFTEHKGPTYTRLLSSGFDSSVGRALHW